MTLLSNKRRIDNLDSVTDQIKNTRRLFNALIESATIGSTKDPKSKALSPTPSTRARIATVDLEDLTKALEGVVRETYRVKEYRKIQSRLNIYISLYYLAITDKYRLVTNLYVMIGEGYYKILKDRIYTTNFNNAERDLLQRQSVTITTRLILQNGYPDYLALTAQIKRLYTTNLKLFDAFLLRSKRIVEEDANDDKVKGDSKHSRVLAGERITTYVARDILLLPTTRNNINASFKATLTIGYSIDFRMNVQTTNSKPIKQQKRSSFNDR